MSAGEESVDLFFLESLSFFFANLYSRKHLISIFRVPESGYNNIFTSILMAFSTNSFQESSSRP